MTSLFDIQLAAFLLESNRRNPELRTILSHFTNTHSSEDEFKDSGVCAHSIYMLTPILTEQLKKEGLWDLFENMEMPLLEVLYSMERRGVKIDILYLQKFAKELQIALAQLEKDIFTSAGEEFSINSPKQLQTILFDKLHLATKKKTKTGFSTDVTVLEELAAVHPLPAKILEYRHIQKLLSTYVEALPKLTDKKSSRVHTTFNQTIAATGRLSSINPNLQNIPIRTELGKKIRKAFIAEEGFKILSADYSQIELRMFAHFSQDPELLKAFHDGADIHARTAALVFGKPEEEVTSLERRYAKTINFGIIYGMGPYRLSQELKIPLFEAKKFIERYFETYKGVATFITQLETNAREQGFLTTISGRKRHFPELQSHNKTVYESGKREAINFPLQGSAADVIKIAMINIQTEFKKRNLKSQMVLQVHDELLFEVHDSEREIVTPLVISLMENAYSLSLPLKVEVGYGTSWLEAH